MVEKYSCQEAHVEIRKNLREWILDLHYCRTQRQNIGDQAWQEVNFPLETGEIPAFQSN